MSIMDKSYRPRSIVGVSVAAIFWLELILPKPYILGYAYIIPVLYADYRINSRWGKWVTVVAVCLTMWDFFYGQYLGGDRIFQGRGTAKDSIVLFNLLLASISLIVAHVLSIRVRSYSELAANRQAEIAIQAGLAALRSDYASTLVHDLQTPLIGAVETIGAIIHGDFGVVTTEQERVLKIVSRAHQGSIHQLDTLLEVCLQDYHGLYLNYQPHNLGTIAIDAIDILADFARHRQVKIEWLNESATGEIECDAERIDRVFTNLLLNAIEQSPRHSSILVQMSETVTHYQVHIIDSGRGIKPQDLPYIFIKHYQGSIGRRSKGAGLGLYLVRQIVETHCGTISVENGTDKGVTFVFTLPKKANTD
jgi:two-component system, NarL family, sensor kinase